MDIKKLTAAAAIILLNAYSYAETAIGPSAIPSEVTVVYPTPDSRVDLGPNASPLGLQQISALFRKELSVNPECTGLAAIYSEGVDTPLQTVGVAGASADLTQPRMGSVLFPRSCTANGRYRVSIPEGFWILEGETPEFSGAFDLYYEILVPQRISPTEGVADELKEFRLEFPGYKEARLLDNKKIEFFRHSSSERYGMSVTQGRNEDGTPANYLLITLDKAIGEQGEYSLFVKAGAAAGVNYDENNEEIIDKNIEALYRYTVSRIPAPAILPPEGTVDGFVPFELTVPDGSDFWFINDRAVSFIYPVEEDGSMSPDAAYRLTASRKEGSDIIVLTIMEDGTPATNVTPQPGNYALKLASGLFSGQWGSEFVNSAPFVYYYQSVGIPESVDLNHATNGDIRNKGIFTIDGKSIPLNVNEETLPEGLYIIDGKKKLINK